MKIPVRWLVLLAALSATSSVFALEATWIYTVQISATIQSSPPQILLSWPPDTYGANSYTVYRKLKNDVAWGPGTPLPGSATSYLDANVSIGAAYEYQIVKSAVLGYSGYGYIYAGIQAPLIENRGKLILIVATNSAAGLDNELNRFQSDLTGDGWTVLRHDVSSNDVPVTVKSLITSDYSADPANVKSLFLFGHVPVLQSGNLNYDGHLARPMPADAYYGDIDGDWSSLPDFLPSDVELMMGRVDFFDMPGAGALVPWPSEKELLRNYLNKDHNWRHKLLDVPRRALMGDRRGGEDGEATAASGYRNFEPLVGPDNTIQANTEDDAPPGQRWIAMLTGTNYLWAYGCGGGLPYGVSQLGTNGDYHDLWSIDVVGNDARAVFVMLFGSWFGNWDGSDNFMRSFLATPTLGLTCCMAGRPHWYMHHMALGEPIGYSTRLSMNNSTLYQSQSNANTRAIYIALMGDPTLRQDPAGPPSNLTAAVSSGNVTLSWSASVDSIAGFHVYRAPSMAGPFLRLTGSLLTGITFTDTNVAAQSYVYMVRAVKLQLTPSGSYFNPSQGVFSSINVIPPIHLLAHHETNGVTLSWNSQIGTVYRVQAKTNLNQSTWSDLTGNLTASGTNMTWTDTNSSSIPARYYRVSL